MCSGLRHGGSLALALVVANAVGVGQAHADEASFTAWANVRLRNDDDNLRVDIGYDVDGENVDAAVAFGLFGRFAASETGDTLIGRMDEFSPKWRLGGYLYIPLSYDGGPTGAAGSRGGHAWYLTIDAEFDVTRFEYQPLDAPDPLEAVEASSALTAVLGARYDTNGTLRVAAFEFRVRYERAWDAQDEVAVVSTPVPTMGETIAEGRIVEPPVASASLALRLFGYFNFGGPGCTNCGSLALGPAVGFTTAGAESMFGDSSNGASWVPGGRDASVRGELWLFYHPIADVPNVRIGIAPFVDGRFACGDPDDCRTDGGVLVGLRYGARWRY